MKKNITINMFGQLYAIDEDAYELLKDYLDAIRHHFHKTEGGDEIADDIEGRIGELFSDLKSSGIQAITIEHVESIIKRIGKPEDISNEESSDISADTSSDNATICSDINSISQTSGVNFSSGNPENQSSSTKKKYYRDGKDKIVAGVLSGAANYFGGDPLAWRLGFVLFTILWNSVSHWWIFRDINVLPVFSIPVLLYILMAFLAPCAKTPEERLKMKGIDVNPQNLASELSEEAKEKDSNGTSGQKGNRSSGCVSGFLSVLGVLAKIFIALFSLFCFVMFVVVIVGSLSILLSPDTYSEHFFDPEIVKIYNHHPGLFWLMASSLLLICFIPGYCAFHSLLSSMGKTANMSMGQRWMWFGLWIASIVMLTISGVNATKIIHKNYIESHTHEGRFFSSNVDWHYLKRNGFHVIGGKPSSDEFDDYFIYTDNGGYYQPRQRYFSSQDIELLDYYQIEREDSLLSPGIYRLTAVARTDGEGAFLYVIADGKKQLCSIPADDTEGGNIWEEATQELAAHPEDSLKFQPIVESNDSCGLGWNRVVIDNIMLKGSSIKYGVSTIPDFTGNPTYCTWVESTDFKLEKVK